MTTRGWSTLGGSSGGVVPPLGGGEGGVLCHAALDAEGAADGGEDGNDELDELFPGFFFHCFSDFRI